MICTRELPEAVVGLLDVTEKLKRTPRRAPYSAPRNGVAVSGHVPEAHCPKYPMRAPSPPPSNNPKASLIIRVLFILDFGQFFIAGHYSAAQLFL